MKQQRYKTSWKEIYQIHLKRCMKNFTTFESIICKKKNKISSLNVIYILALGSCYLHWLFDSFKKQMNNCEEVVLCFELTLPIESKPARGSAIHPHVLSDVIKIFHVSHIKFDLIHEPKTVAIAHIKILFHIKSIISWKWICLYELSRYVSQINTKSPLPWVFNFFHEYFR